MADNEGDRLQSVIENSPGLIAMERRPFNTEEDECIKTMTVAGYGPKVIAAALRRHRQSVIQRQRRLGLRAGRDFDGEGAWTMKVSLPRLKFLE
jgi:hypothetical protein